MRTHPKKNSVSAKTQVGRTANPAGPKAPRRKRWSFYCIAVLGIPLALLFSIELLLRVSDFGYPTGFLLERKHRGEDVFVQNNQFGWRFFGPRMARLPHAICIQQAKPSDTVRIFVFGESAAYGDPHPQFGLPRMLETLLSLRYPGTRFEVINAAMTAINSHTVLSIARDCAEADADLWVVYMGNNEVVGPFGAGTVFGPQTPPLPVIRGSLALKSTRTGQWLDSVHRGILKPLPEREEWGGMQMFIENQVPLRDPRLDGVYRHFERNLADILQAGRRAGAGVVVSTVAVNLRDCAPFTSVHKEGLSPAQRAEWKQLFELATAAQSAGRVHEAAALFRKAERIDESVAELQFRLGQCAAAIGDTTAAREHYGAARDLDALRFRCDSRLNRVIRRATHDRARERILLADAEQELARASAFGIPGSEFFYEHVHLTFEGNYAVARVIATQLEQLLPNPVRHDRSGQHEWPSAADCAQRLGWTDHDRLRAHSEMLARIRNAPFTGQSTHAADVRRMMDVVETLASAGQKEGLTAARHACEQALRQSPDDPHLHAQLASLSQALGDAEAALIAARRQVELLPSRAEAWAQLGFACADRGDFEEAARAFRRAVEWDPQNVWDLQNLAQALVKLGRTDDAIVEYRRILRIKPRFGMAWLALGQALESLGKTSEAEACYREAVANPVLSAKELTILARFCQSRGWLEAAATNYLRAVQCSAHDAALRLEAGQVLEKLGRHSDAAQCYAEAVRLAPRMAQARFLHGLSLGRSGKAAEAAEEFRAALRAMPGLVEARINLATALMHQGRYADALSEFEEVLKHSPDHPVALAQVQQLQGKLAKTTAH